MLTPCEVAVKTVAPAVRAILAQTLLRKHEMKETQVAQILGISQSAVSKYNKKVRGTTISIDHLPEIQNLTNQMIAVLLADPIQKMEYMKLFCKACSLVRSKSLMCPLCQENQKPKIDGCEFCRSQDF